MGKKYLTFKLLLIQLLWCCVIQGNAEAGVRVFQINRFDNSPELSDKSIHAGIDTLRITVARNEHEAARFVVISDIDQPVEAFKVSNLRSLNNNSLTPSSLDLHIIKSWDQLVPYSYKKSETPRYHHTAELLVKNDKAELMGEWKNNRYFPPSPQKEFHTELERGSAKQFWFSIEVPTEQQPGLYSGNVILTGYEPIVIPIEVTVLPLSLPETENLYGLFYRSTLSKGKRSVTKMALQAQFQDIAAHGVNSLVIAEKSPANVLRMLQAALSAGIDGPIVLGWSENDYKKSKNVVDVIQICKKLGYQCYFYGVDEPNTEEKFLRHNRLASGFKAENLRYMSSLMTDYYKKMVSTNHSPSWANFNIRSGIENLSKISLWNGNHAEIQTVYWQLYLEDAPRNRYYAGYYLELAGLDGAVPYCYQAFHSIDPYTVDERELGGNDLRKTRLYKAFMTTYPTTAEPIPTIQWESFREGIDDSRYLQLLKDRYQLKSLSESVGGKRILNMINQNRYSADESSRFKVDKKFDSVALDVIRSEVVSQILRE